MSVERIWGEKTILGKEFGKRLERVFDTASPLPMDLAFTPLPMNLALEQQAETKGETTDEAQKEAQLGRPKRTIKKPEWLNDYPWSPWLVRRFPVVLARLRPFKRRL
ncbi:hypothetical protein L484_013713 [Morus notabilis]|uniref:Uncharacterized protein n=1 Tax=Morus notabilis TaxID=981085 RepID=W9RU38_9ROSA|nr:hypothetical protein L484_013713 [Morus notabilis]